MIDPIFDREYQTARADLNAGIAVIVSGIGKSIADVFRVLNRIEYNAPWLERRGKIRRT